MMLHLQKEYPLKQQNVWNSKNEFAKNGGKNIYLMQQEDCVSVVKDAKDSYPLPQRAQTAHTGDQMTRALDIIYEGFHTYMVEIKHWPCPSKAELEWWEWFKEKVSDGLEVKSGQKSRRMA